MVDEKQIQSQHHADAGSWRPNRSAIPDLFSVSVLIRLSSLPRMPNQCRSGPFSLRLSHARSADPYTTPTKDLGQVFHPRVNPFFTIASRAATVNDSTQHMRDFNPHPSRRAFSLARVSLVSRANREGS